MPLRVLVALLVAAGVVVVAPAAAGPLEPVSGVAVVDGTDGEWTSADDVGPLIGNDTPHLELGRVSLRYDCGERVLFALVLAGSGRRLEATDANEAYLRLGSEPKLVDGTDGVDGDAPDAAWVDPSGGTARGVELSTPLAPGTYDDLRIHAKLADDSDDGYETLDLAGRHQPLELTCAADPPTADDASAVTETPSDPPGPVDLARTGAPLLPLLAAVGAFLIAAGSALRTRRWE